MVMRRLEDERRLLLFWGPFLLSGSEVCVKECVSIKSVSEMKEQRDE